MNLEEAMKEIERLKRVVNEGSARENLLYQKVSTIEGFLRSYQMISEKLAYAISRLSKGGEG